MCAKNEVHLSLRRDKSTQKICTELLTIFLILYNTMLFLVEKGCLELIVVLYASPKYQRYMMESYIIIV